MTQPRNSPPPPESGASPERAFRPTPPTPPARAERAVVLGGFALAALVTAASAILGFGLEPVAAAWIAASTWAFFASLVFALLRGFRRKGRFQRKPRQRRFCGFCHWQQELHRRGPLSDDTELIDWSTQSGAWLDMAVIEENERWMRGG